MNATMTAKRTLGVVIYHVATGLRAAIGPDAGGGYWTGIWSTEFRGFQLARTPGVTPRPAVKRRGRGR